MRMPAGSGMGLVLLVLPLVAAWGQEERARLDRAGEIRIGDSMAALKSRAGWEAAGHGEPDQEAGCEYYQGALLPGGVSMMVLDGNVARFDLDGDAGTGPFDVRVGDAEESALEKLPEDVVVDRHHYGDEGDHYLTWRQPQGTLAFRVETWAGRVERMYWGEWEAVQYVEGCL